MEWTALAEPENAESIRTLRVTFAIIAVVSVLFIVLKWVYLLRKLRQPPPRNRP